MQVRLADSVTGCCGPGAISPVMPLAPIFGCDAIVLCTARQFGRDLTRRPGAVRGVGQRLEARLSTAAGVLNMVTAGPMPGGEIGFDPGRRMAGIAWKNWLCFNSLRRSRRAEIGFVPQIFFRLFWCWHIRFAGRSGWGRLTSFLGFRIEGGYFRVVGTVLVNY